MLINYMAFVDSLFVTFSVSALLWLRFKRPEMRRPIKVSLGKITFCTNSCCL